MNKSTVAIAAWCLYDWACASFFIIVTTFIFAPYFTSYIAADKITGTYLWANAMAIAGLIIAFSSPLLGAIADHGGHHKRWVSAFTAIAVIASALLWFAYPDQGAIYLTLACVIAGTVGLEVALVFYNVFLARLAPKNYLGRISGWGWGCGYIGGILALTIVLMVFIRGNYFSLNMSVSEQIRICGPFVALWYGIFSLPFFIFVPPIKTNSKPFLSAIKAGWRELIFTCKKLPTEKNIFLYLISHMIYADGLNTLFAFGGIYAAGTFGLTFEEILLLGITMNISAGLGAVILGWMDDLLSSKTTVIFSLVCLTFFGIPVILVHDKYYFWGFSLILSLFVGPVQSASRSMMVRLIETKETATEMFGLYALSGRITAFIGPWILGMVTMAFDSQRIGMITILVFFAVGALLILPVKVNQS